MKFPMEHRVQRMPGYKHSTATDIRKTIARVAKEIGEPKVVQRIVHEHTARRIGGAA